MSLGLSGSASNTTSTQQTTGPVAFGSVNIAPSGSSSSSSMWIMLAAAAAAVALLFLKRKQ